MKKEFRISICTILALVVSLYTPISPANSSNVKNGVNCSKENSKVAVAKKAYVCAKNPIVKPNRLTWTRVDCLDDFAVLSEAKDEYENWKDTLAIAGPDGEKTLKDMKSLITQLESTIRSKTCRRGF
jgi:hypothetical protein